MGYDLTVSRGSIRLAEAPILIRELLEFAAQMELEVIPVNWMVSGQISDHQQLLREIFGEKAEESKPLVVRDVAKKTVEHGKDVLWYAMNREHVQGIVLCHHYEEWILTWNVSRGGLLGRYYQLSEQPGDRLFDWNETVTPSSLLSSLSYFVQSEPVEVCGNIAEGNINIHCPWRRSDAVAACDVVKLMARHSDNLEAHDDLGVWPNKDFTKWVNLAVKYAETFGTNPPHPDPTDNL